MEYKKTYMQYEKKLGDKRCLVFQKLHHYELDKL